MFYTQHSDFYFAIHENGFNDAINLAMQFLPSFFNYTDKTNFNSNVACVPINPDPSVAAHGDPIISKIYPPNGIYQSFLMQFPQTPIPLTPLTIQLPQNSLNYVFQLTKLQVDFSPGNVIALPTTVPHPLPSQNLAIHAAVALGLSCPDNSELINCFLIDLFTELSLKNSSSPKFLDIKMKALDIPEFQPDGLRKILDCYAMFLTNEVFGWLSLQIDNIVSNPLPFTPGGVINNIQITPATIPNQNNPALENDQLKLFMNLTSFDLNYAGVSVASSGPSSSLLSPVSKALRSRPGSGPSDFTIALSSGTFNKILADIISGLTMFEIPAPSGVYNPVHPFSNQPWGMFDSPPIHIKYKVGVQLTGGTISLKDPVSGQPNGSIQVDNLQMLWDELKFQVSIDLPSFTVGGIHTSAVTIPNPFGGTITLIPAIDWPGLTFSGGTIQIPLIDLSPLNLVSEASFSAEPVVYYGTGNPLNNLCPNRWQFYVVPQVPIFVWPVFSFNLTNAIKAGINQYFNDLFGNNPGPVVDAIKAALTAVLTGASAFLSDIFTDIDSVTQTIADMILNDIPGIKQALDDLLLKYFTSQAPIFELTDPLIGPSPTSQNWGPSPLASINLPVSGSIGPAKIILPIPIPYLGVTVNSKEMVLEGDIGQ